MNYGDGKGETPYYHTKIINYNGLYIGQIEVHDKAVLEPYFVAWRKKEADSSLWETHMTETEDEAREYIYASFEWLGIERE